MILVLGLILVQTAVLAKETNHEYYTFSSFLMLQIKKH